ncbi:MAG: hypothetical protein M3R40_10340 [Pseudomonadota bacterium]|nr:hypothetical protein [Pseudomonadota bacterium]
MNVRMLRRAIRFASIAALCGASIANAGIFRTYLSLNGNDGNPCTVQLPCRLLPAALAAVNSGGEIWMVDSANFNTAPVIINVSVKILAIPGAIGSVVGSGGDAIVINTTGDVTLRNLQILNFSAGVNGINIQNAAAVQIEKTSIDGFTSGASACIRLDSPNTVRLYVDDSFLRQCNIGIFANGTATSNRTSVIVDNTRIERGFSATSATGVWMQGAVDVSLRNSAISRQDQGIHFENPAGTGTSHLNLDRSEITRSTTALIYANGVTSGQGHISIKNSVVSVNSDQLNVSNTAVGGNVLVIVEDSEITDTSGNGATLSNSAADANTRVQLEMVRSQVKNVTGIAVSLSATNGSMSYLDAHDSELGHAATAVKTAGSTGGIQVNLVRSTINHTTTAIDHGFGEVRLDGNHIVNNSNDFVNNGSGNIVSLGNNMVTDNDNASGFTYITPTIIAPK